MTGYIKLHRAINDWGWYKDSKTLHLFIHLLLSANHKDGEYMGVKVNAGQLIAGRKQLSESTGITEQSIRTSIARLKSTKEITIKSYTKFSLITICKWDDYQVGNQISNQQPTSNQPAPNHKQEGKEYKESKEGAPDWLELIIEWHEFLEHRRDKKKPLTGVALKRMVNKLTKLSKDYHIGGLLSEAIDRGWLDVYPNQVHLKRQKMPSPAGG
jgi:hypothetical protein